MSFKLVPPAAGAGGVNIAASNTTYTSGTVTFTGVGGGITVSSNTGQRVDLSVAAPVASSDTGSLIPLGNTTGTTASIALSGQVALAGGNRITLSGHSDSASRVTISAANDVGSLIPLGNTTGTTASIPVSTNFAIAGGNNITISAHSDSASRITISGPATSAQQTGISSISVTNTEYTSGRVAFTGSNMVTVKSSGAGQTVILDATQSIQTQSVRPKQHVWANIDDVNLNTLSSIQAISKTPFYFPVTVDGDMTMNSVGMRLAAVSSVATSVIQSFSIHMGVYTLVNSTSAALAGSASNSFNLSAASSQSYINGRDFVLTSPSTVAGMSNLTPGNYIFGFMLSGAASQSHAYNIVGGTLNATSVAGMGAVLPGNNSFSTGTSQGLNGFLGQGSSTVAAMPANVSVGDLRNQGSATQAVLPYVFIRS